jgi:predicted metal-dependent hydrolase
MVDQIDLGDITIDVFKRDIKNLHLSVYPPLGRVRISAPLRMDLKTIRIYAISKLSWIKQHQMKLLEQERETPREYLDRESHYLWGRRYLLRVIEKNARPAVTLKHRTMRLQVRPTTGSAAKEAILDAWLPLPGQRGRTCRDR